MVQVGVSIHEKKAGSPMICMGNLNHGKQIDGGKTPPNPHDDELRHPRWDAPAVAQALQRQMNSSLIVPPRK